MVAVADEKRGGKGITFSVGNALALPYEAESMDIVTSRGIVLSHVGKEDYRELLRQCRRVLKIEGVLIIDFLANTRPEEHKIRATKAIFARNEIEEILRDHGFSPFAYSGEPTNRVNAIAAVRIG
jgi:ubiquinone/menaquinone biosynthesis C-methylase UbiE